MAIFSPSLMERLPVQKLSLKRHSGSPQQTPVFHFSGSMAELFTLLREAQNDPTIAGERAQRAISTHSTPWAGFSLASAQAMVDSGYSLDAQKAFNSALARVETKNDRAPITYREVGGSWSIPRTLSGHPRSAFYRPKSRLPAKDWQIGACFMAAVKAPDVAEPLAKIARAAWAYLEQGGAVTLTIHYSAQFSRPCGGADGLVLSIKVPLSNPAAIATACSVQLFRCAVIALGVALSRATGDSLPTAWLVKPSLINIQGSRLLDSSALSTLGIL